MSPRLSCGGLMVAAALAFWANSCGPTGAGGTAQQDAAIWPDGGRPTRCDPADPSYHPQAEQCDSVDNDCNGMVDDGIAPRANPVACGVQICQLGQWIDAPPEFAIEVCNNCDDDSDGCVDGSRDGSGNCTQLTRQDPSSTEGCPMVQRCVNGQWVNDGAVNQSDEVCDGIDNDCNGTIDDIAAVPCFADCNGTTQIGFTVCENGQVICQPNGFINLEICDGIDNDCDGVVDEGVLPEPCSCGTGQKICQDGHYVGDCVESCVQGTWRWCDDPQKCHWGRQQCVQGPDGETMWDVCTETTDRPIGCDGDLMYDPNCCDQAGECCQDAFHSWLSCGHCETQCNGQQYTPCT